MGEKLTWRGAGMLALDAIADGRLVEIADVVRDARERRAESRGESAKMSPPTYAQRGGRPIEYVSADSGQLLEALGGLTAAPDAGRVVPADAPRTKPLPMRPGHYCGWRVSRLGDTRDGELGIGPTGLLPTGGEGIGRALQLPGASGGELRYALSPRHCAGATGRRRYCYAVRRTTRARVVSAVRVLPAITDDAPTETMRGLALAGGAAWRLLADAAQEAGGEWAARGVLAADDDDFAGIIAANVLAYDIV